MQRTLSQHLDHSFEHRVVAVGVGLHPGEDLVAVLLEEVEHLELRDLEVCVGLLACGDEDEGAIAEMWHGYGRDRDEDEATSPVISICRRPFASFSFSPIPSPQTGCISHLLASSSCLCPRCPSSPLTAGCP